MPQKAKRKRIRMVLMVLWSGATLALIFAIVISSVILDRRLRHRNGSGTIASRVAQVCRKRCVVPTAAMWGTWFALIGLMVS